jgi:hypothetical protein
LPALAAILKIRKRKLAAQATSSSNAVTTDTASVTTESTNSLVSSLSAKISSFDNNVSQSGNLSNSLNVLSLQIEASNRLNLSVLSQAQLTTLFYN